MGFRVRPRRRQAPDEMNKTEQAYAERLELQRMAGEVLKVQFASVKLRLAKRTWYTPDFYVVTPERVEFHEVKGGFIRDDAIVKLKVVAEMYPEFQFVLVRRANKKEEWRFDLL